MSANVRSSRGRLSARTVRVRNRCLAALAARRSLPIPTDAELAALGDDVALSDAWTQWHTSHTPPKGTVEVTPPATKRAPTKWRPRLAKLTAIAAAGLLGFIVGERWLPGAGAQAGDLAAEKQWLPVTDSVVTSLNAKLRAATNDGSARLTLSAADIATLIFRSPRRRQTPVDSIEARIDSLLWIRGRLRGGSRFALGGRVHLARRGLAEFRVEHISVGGVDADSAQTARIVVGVRSRSSDTERMRFEVPPFVAGVAVAEGAVELLARPRQ
jgi:hypothetical protein